MKIRCHRFFLVMMFLFATSLTTSCRLLDGFKRWTNEFETETDEGAVERMRDWEIDLPEDTKVAHRFFFPYPGWDGYYSNAYYIFQVNENYAFDSEILSSDYETLKRKWDDLYDGSVNWSEEVNEWPDFESEMQCIISFRFKKIIKETDDDSSSLENDNLYYHKYFDKEDEHYCRGDGFFLYPYHYRYVGKGYFILQKNQQGLKFVYSYLTIDDAEIKHTPL